MSTSLSLLGLIPMNILRKTLCWYNEQIHAGAGKSYLWIGVTADNNVNWAWCALAQDCVDIIQCHVVNHSVVDLHDFITTPKSVEKKLSKCAPAPVYMLPWIANFTPPLTPLTSYMFIFCQHWCLYCSRVVLCHCTLFSRFSVCYLYVYSSPWGKFFS